ncbi:calcium-binding protein [Microvirga sp. VF16]|uniref:calcium-binding protein n=1 Tax=Microvirga sp. VF16 TaxID=2807101 RepID=UPI00193CBCC5|nr:calcium-binding protein [Microvirga sp. VF16]QRM28126.1 hypothetical protein JO965_17990 [Microvirga sp. VF16]
MASSGVAGVTTYSAGLTYSVELSTAGIVGSGASLAVVPIGLVIAGFLLGPPRDPREIEQDTDWGDSTFVPRPETPENPQPVHEVAQFAVGGKAYFVEILRGTAKADHLVGNGGLSGFEGDDTLTGGDRADILMGGSDNDLLVGGLGHDILTGGLGADILDGGEGFDLANYAQSSAGVVANLSNAAENTGEAAGDRYSSIEGLTGSAYDDRLVGNALHNVLQGGAGDDLLEGGEGSDQLVGGEGIDYASYENAAAGVTAKLTLNHHNEGEAAGDVYASIEGLIGSRFKDELAGDKGTNDLQGRDGNDVLIGLGGQDRLDGGLGDDTLYGGIGADHLVGSFGIDWAAYSVDGTGVTVHLAKPHLNTGEAAGDTYDGIENVSGTKLTDTLVGDAKNNVLSGLGSDDILRGGLGADTLDGGEGFDWASYAEATSGVRADLANRALNTGEAGGDAYVGIEALEGSNHGDQLAGDGAGNALSGLGGNDVLQGRDGNDTLDGGLGDDTLYGGTGADHLIGSYGTDWVSYADAIRGVNVSLADGRGYHGSLNGGAEAAGDTYDGVENVEGSNGGDVLAGHAGANHLRGLGGDDILQGGGGADTLDGGEGFNWASYAGATAGVTASLSYRSLNTGEAAGDVYIGIRGLQGSNHNDVLAGDATTLGNALSGLGGNDSLLGQAGGDHLDGGDGDDTLSGNGANDILLGGNGSDRLSGGAGADQLTGGAGGDNFRFDTALGGGNIDTITDFTAGQDLIVLSRGVFTAFSGGWMPSLTVSASAFTIGAAASSSAHRLVYNGATGALSYDADGVGGVAQVQFATLAKNLALTAHSFLLI